MRDCETLCIPILNKRTLTKQIIARWLRLAFPNYLIVLFTITMYIFIGSGPAFYNVISFNILDPLKERWWTIMLFISNFLPWGTLPGLYWMYYVANDL